MGNSLSYQEQILIIICAAAVAVVVGYAMFRLMFAQIEEPSFHVSDEQLAYMRNVRDRNISDIFGKSALERRA
jgi:hypothetical protein